MSDSTLEVIAALVREVIDEDLGPIARGSSFADDLELESIELVALAERVEATWGGEVDFAGWIAGKSLDELLALTVGDLVDHVDARRR